MTVNDGAKIEDVLGGEPTATNDVETQLAAAEAQLKARDEKIADLESKQNLTSVSLAEELRKVIKPETPEPAKSAIPDAEALEEMTAADRFNLTVNHLGGLIKKEIAGLKEENEKNLQQSTLDAEAGRKSREGFAAGIEDTVTLYPQADGYRRQIKAFEAKYPSLAYTVGTDGVYALLKVIEARKADDARKVKGEAPGGKKPDEEAPAGNLLSFKGDDDFSTGIGSAVDAIDQRDKIR